MRCNAQSLEHHAKLQLSGRLQSGSFAVFTELIYLIAIIAPGFTYSSLEW